MIGEVTKTKKKPKTSKVGLVGGSINEGIADTLGAPVDLVTAGLNAFGAGIEKPLGGSESIRSGLHKLGFGQVKEEYKPQTKGEEYLSSLSRGVGQAAGGLVSTAPISINAAKTLTKTSGAAKRALAQLTQGSTATPTRFVAQELMAGAGSGIGGQAARDVAPGNPWAEGAGMLVGGIAGGLPVQTAKGIKAGVDATGDAIERAGDAKRYVKAGQIAKDPDAPYVAEFAQDLADLAGKRSANAPKGRAVFTAKQVNDVIDGYMEQYGNMINRLPIKESEKTAIRTAIGQKWSITPDKLDALLDPVTDPAAKEALKQGIKKTQIAYDYTPELPRGGFGRAAANVVEGAATAGGAITGGVPGAFMGSGAGTAIKRLLRGFSADAGEAARVNSAEKLAKKAKLYRYVQDRTGPSPQPAADRAFKQHYADIVDAPKLPKTKAPDALDELVRKNIANGIEGNPAITANYASRSLGVPPEDAKRALQFIAEKHPELADDANALRLGYATFTPKGKFGRAATPLMRKFLEDDGTYQRLKQQAIDGGIEAPIVEGVRKGNQTPLQVDIGDPGIRNPEAYRATAQGNQNRVSQTLSAIQGHAALPEPSKALLSEAATTLGNTSKKADAEAVVQTALESLPDDQKALGELFLKPLLAQIKK
ncbi:hypothetical protein [Tardibacter chloracetimidivorans]|uniref:hypothetical protein n=1 Tax=Tardibacter chloracetimidivorans TaxID=1921510 RepID=UPI001300F766|nr:hypothetical protein [Tardibacter chloracetimidivorans]